MDDNKNIALGKCASCGNMFKLKSLYCPHCGQKRILDKRPVKLKCPSCNMDITAEQRFCTGCGKALRPLAFCEHCEKNGRTIPLLEGARFCHLCGEPTFSSKVDFITYQNEVMQREDWDENNYLKARIIGHYAQGYGSGVHPLLHWNGFLISISSGIIYIYNVNVAKKGEAKLRPFSFSDGNYPKVSYSIGVHREYGDTFPALFKVIGGMLIVPCRDRLFLWDMVSNIMERSTAESRGGRRGYELELGGDLIADIATDENRFFAVLVRLGKQGKLCVYEMNKGEIFLYYSWSVGEVSSGCYSLYCTEHNVYMLCQPELGEPGNMRTFSLDDMRSRKLERWEDSWRYLLSFDCRQELVQLVRKNGYSAVLRFHNDQLEPSLLLDNTVLPQCYGRDGQAFWIVGRTLSFADGQNNLSIVDGLDENLMRMSVPPVRCHYGLFFVDIEGNLNAIRQSEGISWKKKIAVKVDGRDIHLNRLSPLINVGSNLYGYSDVGLVAINMTIL